MCSGPEPEMFYMDQTEWGAVGFKKKDVKAKQKPSKGMWQTGI